MQIGFIGAGNMATAIIRGMIAAKFAASAMIHVYDTDRAKLTALCEATGIQARISGEDVIAHADVIVLAIKPNAFAAALPSLRPALTKASAVKTRLLISIAAGTALAKISALLGDGARVPIVRVMPNVNAEIGASMSALCGNAAVTDEQMGYAVALFDTLGRTARIPEEQFSIFSAVACASPAFVFMFIEALAKGGLKAGMTKKEATLAAAQAVMGSARLVLASGEAPCVLVDKVCSPGGTTIAGVAALEEGGLTATIMRAVAATTNRDVELLGK